MRLTQVTLGSTEIELADGTCILFSGSFPVAALVPGKGWIRTEQSPSPTATKHANAWLMRHCGGTVQNVPQWELDKLVAF